MNEIKKDEILGKMPLRQRIIVVAVAVVCGLAAMLLVNVYIDNKVVDVSGGRLVPVIFAAADISKETPITEKMLQIKNVPEAYLGFDAVTEYYKGFLIGQNAIVNIKKDQAILWLNIKLEDERHLAQKLAINQRAVAIPVDDVSGINGLIRPGDTVDVIGYFNIPNENYSNMESVVKVLLQNALVLAVGSNIAGSSDSFSNITAQAGKLQGVSSSDETAKTVTLRVTPKEASFLAFAGEQGKIRLILRSKEDVFINNIGDVGYDNIFELGTLEALSGSDEKNVSGYATMFYEGVDVGSSYYPGSDFLSENANVLPENMNELKNRIEDYEAITDEALREN